MPRLRRWAKRLGLGAARVVRRADDRLSRLQRGDGGRCQAGDRALRGAVRARGRKGGGLPTLGGSRNADHLARRLRRAERVCALDLPPFGYTERKGPYTLRGWIEIVRAFETRFGLHRPVLVGHSLGAAVVVADALWRRADPRGIVLIDGDAISAGGAPSWLGKVLVGPWFTSVYRIATSSDWIFRRGLADAYPHHPSFTRAFLEEWERPFKVQRTLDAFRTMLHYGIQGFQLSQLRTVRVPALVLWGAQDTVDPVPAGRKSAQALRAPFHLLAGAGHLSMLAAPNAIAREVDSFARH